MFCSLWQSNEFVHSRRFMCTHIRHFLELEHINTVSPSHWESPKTYCLCESAIWNAHFRPGLLYSRNRSCKDLRFIYLNSWRIAIRDFIPFNQEHRYVKNRSLGVKYLNRLLRGMNIHHVYSISWDGNCYKQNSLRTSVCRLLPAFCSFWARKLL